MSRKVQPKPTKNAQGRGSQTRPITITEARRIAFEANDQAQQAQIKYAEEEANRTYDYRIDE